MFLQGVTAAGAASSAASGVKREAARILQARVDTK